MKRKIILCLTVAAILLITMCGCFETAQTENTVSYDYTTSSKIKGTESSTSKTSSETVYSETVSKESQSEAVSSEKASSYTAVSSESESSAEQSSTQSQTVYRTPTGKRYHLDPDCGGKNSTATTLQKAIDSGLTPCKKCAQ